MTPGIRAPFFLMLLLAIVPGEGTVLFPTSSSDSSPQVSVGVSFFFLSFHIWNQQFNSSLEDPSSNYYQELKRNISGLAVCQCRRKNYGHLDIFPTQDTYHPMSEYPTYHTHGRYVPPGSTKRNPYEEVNLGHTGWGKGPGWVRVSGEVLGKPKVLQRGEQGRAWRGGGGR
uniref:Mucin-1 n=1 Tax=Peromyscus maniculatus bairdii TaxID=230844 RepID=A0A8C8UE30_PERMB